MSNLKLKFLSKIFSVTKYRSFFDQIRLVERTFGPKQSIYNGFFDRSEVCISAVVQKKTLRYP